MTCGSIYKIEFPNGKHYIGLTTTSLEQRAKEHKKSEKNGHTSIIYKAIRKYGMVETLELVEIDTADSKEELCEKEIDYIQKYNSYYINGYGYNMTLGGEGTNGYVFTEEDNKKNSEKLKKHYEENPEAREQMSEIKKKYYDNPDAIKKNSEAQKKYHDDHPKARQQMSERRKKYYENNPEGRREISKKRQHNPFDVFTIDGTFIKTFTYQFEAKEYLQTEYKITSTFKISEVLAGKRNSSAGFVFKYK
jgi:group I intron endonuclease